MKNDLITIRQLDHQLLHLKEQRGYLIPKQGWVRTIRKALGMTIKQLATRLEADPSRVVKIETSETQGAITLRTLQSVAEIFNCTFVYYFIPKTSLEGMVKEQAKKIAADQIKRTAHTMNLEAQTVEKNWLKEQTEDLIGELLRKPWKHLWKK